MLFYWQFRKKLAQTANKLNLQLVEIVNIVVTQAFTPPPSNKKANKEHLIVCSFVCKNCGMVKLFENSLPCY